MRALLNFMDKIDGIHISFCDATATKGIGRAATVKDREALLRMVEKMHGDVNEAAHSLRCWGQGSCWVYLSPAQCRYFGIKFTDGHQ